MSEALVPFQHMLQAVITALLAPAPQLGTAVAGEPAASLPLLLKMLASMRGTEDNVAVRGGGADGMA